MQSRSNLAGRTASRAGAIALLTLALCAATTSVHAQTVPAAGAASGETDLKGTVVDSRTGRPLPLVTVEIPRLRRSTLTDEQGRFELARIPAGEHGMVLRLVGYTATSRPVVAGSDAPIQVSMTEDPVLLTGITVTVNRFDRRMKAAPYSVRVHTKQDVFNSAAPNAAEFVVRRGGLMRVGCRSIRQSTCFSIRGSSVEPRVYLDDVPVLGGVDMLAIIPREEINRVEVIRNGMAVRVYTDRFMEWAARNNYRPMPLSY